MAREYFQLVKDRGVSVFELRMPAGTDVSEFDALNQSALAQLDGASAGDGWVMDMGEFTYVGSAALGFMINVRQRIREAGGVLVLCGVSAHILATLRASSLGRLFTIVATRDEAIATAGAWRAGGRSRRG
jgi:anti-anti-sigma factor